MRKELAPSDRPLISGKPALSQVSREEMGRYILLVVRDPLIFKKDPAEEISLTYLENVKKVADTMLYKTYTGTYKNVKVSIVSTGSGAPDVEILLGELIMFTSADTVIRVGCSGAIQEYIKPGELVIVSAAVRDDGASAEYVSKSFPSVANYEVLISMIEAAEKLGVKYHVGITRSNDSFWVGQGRPIKEYLQCEHEKIIEYWKRAGVLCVERETSLILTLANLFNLRAGSILAVVNNRITGELNIGAGIQDAIKVVLESLVLLNYWDRLKEEKKKKYWYPSIHLNAIE